MTEDTAADLDGLSTELLNHFAQHQPHDFASALADIPVGEVGEICGRLEDAQAAAVIARLPDSVSDAILRSAAQDRLARWLTTTDADDAAAIAGRLSESERRDLRRANPDNLLLRERLRQLHESQLGGLLHADFLRVPEDATQADIVAELKRRGSSAHRSIFVCAPGGRFTGVIELSRALAAEAQTPASVLMRRVEPIPVRASIAAAAKVATWRWYRELPVVDDRHRLVGSLVWGDLQARLDEPQNRHAPVASLTTLGVLQTIVDLMTGILDMLLRPGRERDRYR